MGKNPGLGIALAVLGAFATACGYTLQKLAHRRAEASASAGARGRVKSRSGSSSGRAMLDEDGPQTAVPGGKRRRADGELASASSSTRSGATRAAGAEADPHGGNCEPGPAPGQHPRESSASHDLEAITEASGFDAETALTGRRRTPTSQPQPNPYPNPSPLPSSSVPSSSPVTSASPASGLSDPKLGEDESLRAASVAASRIPSPAAALSVAMDHESSGGSERTTAFPFPSSSSSSSSSRSRSSSAASASSTGSRHGGSTGPKPVPYFRFWQFPAGLGMLIVGSIIAVFTFGLAGQAELAPMSAVTLVWSELLAWRVLKEDFTRIDAASVLLMSLGTTIALVFAERGSSSVSYDLSSILHLLNRPAVYAYGAISAAAIIAGVVTASRLGKKKPSELSRFQQSVDAFCRACVAGLLGGFTGFLVKSLVEIMFRAISSGYWGAFERPEFYLILFLMVAVLFNQVRYMNKGLARYDSSRIIPLYQSTLVFSGSVSGLLLWDEIAYQTALSLTLFGIGCCTTIAGVAMLSLKPPTSKPHTTASAEAASSTSAASSAVAAASADVGSGAGLGIELTEQPSSAPKFPTTADDEAAAALAERKHLSEVSHTFETIEVLAAAAGMGAINPSISEDLSLELGEEQGGDNDEDDEAAIGVDDDDYAEAGEAPHLEGETAPLYRDRLQEQQAMAPSPAKVSPTSAAAAALMSAVGMGIKQARSPPPSFHPTVDTRRDNDGRMKRRAPVPLSASAALEASRTLAYNDAGAAVSASTKMADGRDQAASQRQRLAQAGDARAFPSGRFFSGSAQGAADGGLEVEDGAASGLLKRSAKSSAAEERKGLLSAASSAEAKA